jgi:tryptophanyl-tRNA synthetase
MRILTGITPSGTPHIGNYFGMMRQAIEFQNDPKNECFYFISDLHAFTTARDPEIFKKNQRNVVLDWLALGLDPEKTVFYRQSDIRSHTEWYLSCLMPMGMLERAHAFKDKKARGLEANAGLFTYPVLMAADILLYDAQKIPVGKDQKQHVEIARDIAQKFNSRFGETFVLPEPSIPKELEIIPGIDGEKMSKSYGNTIPIFEKESEFRKKIMSIKTESVPLGKKLDPDNCIVFQFHKLFRNPDLEKLREEYLAGSIGFGESKKRLFALAWEYFAEARTRREKFEKTPELIDEILHLGAKKASAISEAKLGIIREKLGLDRKHF